jgi:uncharacterized protein
MGDLVSKTRSRNLPARFWLCLTQI